MAKPGGREEAAFFCGILAAGRDELASGAEALEREFGPAERGSRIWPFKWTDYYRDELGPNPLRAFMAWPGLFDTTELAARKLTTNRLETDVAARLARALPRPVNLDPGYLTRAKLVLASAKNYTHRIHLRDGIYAEVTLQYRGKGFHALPWTFPDYRSGAYDGFFLELRRSIGKEKQEH